MIGRGRRRLGESLGSQEERRPRRFIVVVLSGLLFRGAGCVLWLRVSRVRPIVTSCAEVTVSAPDTQTVPGQRSSIFSAVEDEITEFMRPDVRGLQVAVRSNRRWLAVRGSD